MLNQMEEIQQLCVKRRGLKGSIMKLLAKVDEAVTAELKKVQDLRLLVIS